MISCNRLEHFTFLEWSIADATYMYVAFTYPFQGYGRICIVVIAVSRVSCDRHLLGAASVCVTPSQNIEDRHGSRAY